MIQNSELPIISRILRQAHSDSTFPLQERISSLALQVIKDNSPDRLNSLWNPSNLYEPKKELKAQLNLKIGSLVDEILHSGTSPLHDPHGVLALKHAVISQSPDVAFYFRRLDLRVEPFLQNIYCESFDIEYTSSIQPTHYLWAGDLFVEEQSIFDYIHEKLEGDLELGSPTVVKLVKAQALNNAELLSSNLFSMLFLRIAQESDAETFKKLLLPLSHDIKEAFFAFCKKLPRRFTTRDYSDPKLLHYLSFFENSGSLTLIKIIEDIPLGKQASILQSINITDPELVYQVAKTLLSKNESIFFATIDQFPLDEKRKNTLIIEAVRNSKELYRIHFLLNSRGNLICPESCFFEIIDKLLNQAEAKIDTWGSSLYELNRAFNVNSRTRFMPLVWGKALFRAFEMFSRGDRPYDEQLKIAASWIRHMPPWVDPDIFIDFFAKENPAFLEFTDKWKREPNKKIYEKILTSGMRLLSCFHEAGLPTPPYVFEHILPLAVVSQTATIQLDYISNYLEPTQFITLMEFLEFAHPESETGLCEKEILTGIKPYFSEIDEEKWDYLENLSNIENAKIRQNLFTFVKDAAPQIPIIPGIIFDNIIPTIAKCRNKELLLILENSFHKILHTRRILKNYEQLITSSSSNHL
ncbi:MAG: hypothetical protein KBC64_07680, partial [Simkaniaceae bacterium]|nr:hypothetical protein [Simkaniaceae bacterium]